MNTLSAILMFLSLIAIAIGFLLFIIRLVFKKESWKGKPKLIILISTAGFALGLIGLIAIPQSESEKQIAAMGEEKRMAKAKEKEEIKKKADQERIEKEEAQKKIEEEKIAKEKTKKEEQEKLEMAKEEERKGEEDEAKRLAKEKAEQQKLAKEQANKEELAKKKAEEESRLKAEQKAKEDAEVMAQQKAEEKKKSEKESYLNGTKPKIDQLIANYDLIWTDLWAPTFNGLSDGSVDQYGAYKQMKSIEIRYENLYKLFGDIPAGELNTSDKKAVDSFKSSMQKASLSRSSAAKKTWKMLDSGNFSPSTFEKIEADIKRADSQMISALAEIVVLEQKYDIKR
ncbi:hypothetical protein [Peribacillus loiseleuriae]|uniref:hypothetical protein n=1 Tax=Peribacillus loiseleuriae TaxID=1679170 RepID=UPI003D042F25